MNILVIGSTGRVGHLLTEKLIQKGHQVVGTSRKEELLFDASNYSQINLDLLAEQDEMVKGIPTNIDLIYFVSGSRGKNLLQVDLHGAIKTIEAAKRLQIRRYIMLSFMFSLEPEKWKENGLEKLTNYNIAKHYADHWLLNSELDYTILQPGMLTEKEGSGKIEINTKTLGENSIDNVATTLAELAESKASIHKVITMKDGETPIKDAVEGL
ncbi:NAD(P)H-binding protein [Sediminitomix flava]|uniref:Putative NAD(P)-binding protein n=1 Tax=Sediminitomix flava TaxID=379075 RepID=A0A315Z2F0_SEDFL|nr:NAD(P)H-binding protein [Sediminitomix flava]PWJ36170.1 putative NAD(P)-binding protein [Sediminitomix flava]